MASAELEELAASAGIEIVQDNTELQASHADQRLHSSLSLSTEVTSEKNATPEKTVESCVYPADILAKCGDACLAELQDLFSQRYTQDDQEFTHTLSTPTLPPPCITNWWSMDRNFDRSRGRRGQGHWGRGRGSWDYRDGGDFRHRSHGYHGYHERQENARELYYHRQERQYGHHRDRSPDRRYRY